MIQVEQKRYAQMSNFEMNDASIQNPILAPQRPIGIWVLTILNILTSGILPICGFAAIVLVFTDLDRLDEIILPLFPVLGTGLREKQ